MKSFLTSIIILTVVLNSVHASAYRDDRDLMPSQELKKEQNAEKQREIELLQNQIEKAATDIKLIENEFAKRGKHVDGITDKEIKIIGLSLQLAGLSYGWFNALTKSKVAAIGPVRKALVLAGVGMAVYYYGNYSGEYAKFLSKMTDEQLQTELNATRQIIFSKSEYLKTLN